MRRLRHWPERTASSELRQIEPRPMLGRVHPLKALDEAASFRCWEGLVERRLGVDVQVVLKQRDPVGVREVVVGDLLENVGIIYGGMPLGHLHLSPAFE